MFWADVSLVIYPLMRPPSLPSPPFEKHKSLITPNMRTQDPPPVKRSETPRCDGERGEGGHVWRRYLGQLLGDEQRTVDSNYNTETWLLSVSQNNDEAEKSLSLEKWTNWKLTINHVVCRVQTRPGTKLCCTVRSPHSPNSICSFWYIGQARPWVYILPRNPYFS